jgi:type II secretory pathway component GspD/PulD (secretin)
VVVAHPVKAPVVVVAPARPPVVVAAPVKTVAVAQPTPVRQPVTPVRQPVTPVRQPVTPVPVASNPSDRLVSLTYPGGDLAGALRALAKAAGIQAQIDPGVSGYVTESFTDMPLNQAVTSVLGRQTELYNYKITATALIVTAPSGSSGGATLHSTAATGTAQVSDYFPIKLKPVADVYQAAHRAFPELTYQVDERLNVLFAEGDPAIMERLRKLLQNVSAK